jgi:hypothetical protein
MARESREVWVKRVERWRESGLTAQEFAAELGVNAVTLANWKYRLSAEERKATRDAASADVEIEAPTFVEISPTQTRVESGPVSVATMFEVVLAGGAILRVPAQFDAVALRRLLDVMAPR